MPDGWNLFSVFHSDDDNDNVAPDSHRSDKTIFVPSSCSRVVIVSVLSGERLWCVISMMVMMLLVMIGFTLYLQQERAECDKTNRNLLEVCSLRWIIHNDDEDEDDHKNDAAEE